MEFQHDSFEMFLGRVAITSIAQGRLRLNHDLLNPLFVPLDGFEAHLGVRTEHSTADNFECEGNHAAKSLEVWKFTRLGVFVMGNIGLAHCRC